LSIAGGNIALVGEDAGVLYGRVFHVNGASYEVTGYDAILRLYVLDAMASAYAITGLEATLLRGVLMNVDGASCAISGGYDGMYLINPREKTTTATARQRIPANTTAAPHKRP